jgi:hypothetical protein
MPALRNVVLSGGCRWCERVSRMRFFCSRRGPDMDYKAINFAQKFSLFAERWQPKVVAEMNEYQYKIVKLEGDFIWHDHKDTARPSS